MICRAKVWGSDFRRSEENSLLGKALELRRNFQKYALKLIKIGKLLRKFEKNANLTIFIFQAALRENKQNNTDKL